MKKLLAAVAMSSAAFVSVVPAAHAGASTDAALGLGAFAVFNQLVRGDTIFHDIFFGRPAPVVVPTPVAVPVPPPVVYAPAPPPPVVYVRPPAVVYVPPAPAVVVVKPRPVIYPARAWVPPGHRHGKHGPKHGGGWR